MATIDWEDENSRTVERLRGRSMTLRHRRGTTPDGQSFEVTARDDGEPARIRHTPTTRFGADRDALIAAYMADMDGDDGRLRAAVSGQEIGYALDHAIADAALRALLASDGDLPPEALRDAGFGYRHTVCHDLPHGPIEIYGKAIAQTGAGQPNWLQAEIGPGHASLSAEGDDVADEGRTNVFRIATTERDSDHPAFWEPAGGTRADAMVRAVLAAAGTFAASLPIGSPARASDPDEGDGAGEEG